MTTFLSSRIDPAGQQRGEADGAAGLDHQLQFAVGERDRRSNFCVGNADAFCQQLAVDREGHLAGHRRHQRVADGAGGGGMGFAVPDAQATERDRHNLRARRR